MRKLGSEKILVAESLDLIDFNKLISLNDSAAYVWNSLPDTYFDTDTVKALLTDRYDVDDDTARKDAQQLIDVWLQAAIIEKT